MEITIKLNEQHIEDVFVTAIEGGSNYWFDFNYKDVAEVRRVCEEDNYRDSLCMQIYYAVFRKGLKLPVYDDWSEEQIGVLDVTNFGERLQNCMDNHPEAIYNTLFENGDANDADIIFEYLCINELVYG